MSEPGWSPKWAGGYVTTVRMPMGLYEELKMVADADGMTVSDEIRQAIGKYMTKRRADPEFQKRLKERMARDAALLERLSQENRGGTVG